MKQPGQPLGLGFADTAFAIELSETAHKSLGFAASSRAQLTLVASPSYWARLGRECGTFRSSSRAYSQFALKVHVVPLGSDHILALHHAARIRPSGHVFESDVVRQRPEQGDPASEEHGYARDDQALD